MSVHCHHVCRRSALCCYRSSTGERRPAGACCGVTHTARNAAFMVTASVRVRASHGACVPSSLCRVVVGGVARRRGGAGRGGGAARAGGRAAIGSVCRSVGRAESRSADAIDAQRAGSRRDTTRVRDRTRGGALAQEGRHTMPFLHLLHSSPSSFLPVLVTALLV